MLHHCSFAALLPFHRPLPPHQSDTLQSRLRRHMSAPRPPYLSASLPFLHLPRPARKKNGDEEFNGENGVTRIFYISSVLSLVSLLNSSCNHLVIGLNSVLRQCALQGSSLTPALYQPSNMTDTSVIVAAQRLLSFNQLT